MSGAEGCILPVLDPRDQGSLCEGSGAARLLSSTEIRAEAAATLCLAAHGLHNSRSAPGAFLRRKKAHLGPPKGITATAHKLARLVLSKLENGSDYVEVGQEEYERRYRARANKNLKPKARSLGFHLVLHVPAAPG